MDGQWVVIRQCCGRVEAYLDDLGSEAASDGFGDLVGSASLEKLWCACGFIDGERAMNDTLLGLHHDDKPADASTGDKEIDGARSLDLADIEGDTGEEPGGLFGAALDVTALADGAATVKAVDDLLGLRRQLGCGKAPVLETFVGITEALDAADRVGGVKAALCGVEGVQGGVGGDAGAAGGGEAGAARVRVGEGVLGGIDGLPVGPETVDVGVVHHAGETELGCVLGRMGWMAS